MVNAEAAQFGFRSRFPGLSPEVTAFAPGRVNLVGEHVDYNDGLVLPMAIQLGTTVVAARLEQWVVRASSARVDSQIEFRVDPGGRVMGVTPDLGWGRYVAGVWTELAREGIEVGGAAFYVDGDLPVAAGLSSSASLCAALSVALVELCGGAMDARAMAHLCRRVERDYAGVPCGIMDPFAVLMSRAGHALMLDCRDETIEQVPIPQSLELFVLDSGVARALADGRYALRRRECEAALERIRGIRPEIRSFRDVSPDNLAEIVRHLPDPLDRRARHVVTEMARTREAADALSRGDLGRFGGLLDESHASLRDDFEVSLPAIDQLVREVRGVASVLGARLTGAGFGGCILAAGLAGCAERVRAALEADDHDRPRQQSRMFVVVPSSGVV